MPIPMPWRPSSKKGHTICTAGTNSKQHAVNSFPEFRPFAYRAELIFLQSTQTRLTPPSGLLLSLYTCSIMNLKRGASLHKQMVSTDPDPWVAKPLQLLKKTPFLSERQLELQPRGSYRRSGWSSTEGRYPSPKQYKHTTCY
jgi:hypothetical protein